MNELMKELRPESLGLLNEVHQEHWQYSIDSLQDFSMTNEQLYDDTPVRTKFMQYADVLVRWTDGLLYFGHITQVDEPNKQCEVKFQDGSVILCQYKDMYKGPPPDNEFACSLCDKDTCVSGNEIVICDKCSIGYHQLCHIPKINECDIESDLPWNCRKCVFAAAAKKGGAIKKGRAAQAMMKMKKTLPYDIKSLTWDEVHKTNNEQTYCYCGGPGDLSFQALTNANMFQCLRCKQWFHEACLQCIEEGFLPCDRFYVFICSVCNRGPEFLRHLPCKWADIAHLVIYNLVHLYGRKFYDFEKAMIPFLKDHWLKFKLQGETMSELSFEDKRKRLLDSLHKSKRFEHAKDMKRKNVVWGLSKQIPPKAPIIHLPETGTITNEIFDAYITRKWRTGNKSRRLLVRRRNHQPLPENSPILETEKVTVKDDDSSTLMLAVQKTNKEIIKKEKRKLPHRRARYIKTNNLNKNQNSEKQRVTRTSRLSNVITISDSDDTSSSQGTLNSIIPHPTDFEGSNNPFLSSVKKSKKSNSSIDSKSSFDIVNNDIKESEFQCSILRSSSRQTEKVSLGDGLEAICKYQDSLLEKQEIPTQEEKINLKNSEFHSDMGSSDSSTQKYVDLETNSHFEPPRNLLDKNAVLLNLSPRTKSKNRALKLKTSTESRRACKLRKTAELRRNELSIQLRVRPTRKYTTDLNVSETVENNLISETHYKINEDDSPKPFANKPKASNSDLGSSVSCYFGAADRINSGEKFSLLAKRICRDGTVQYLVEWHSCS